jgi:hypothetical protein
MSFGKHKTENFFGSNCVRFELQITMSYRNAQLKL